MTTVCP